MANLPNVPAPKNSGLSLLADTANEEQGVYHYPVRRRGLPRALLPNWDAIAWLEADKRDTEIEYQETDQATGLVNTFAYGRVEKSYPRPMFQVIHDEAFSSFRGIAACACPCGDFSRTAYCPEHQELDFDWNRRCWIRPGTAIWYEHHPEDRPAVVEPDPPTAYYDTGARPPGAGALYDRMIEMFGQQLPATNEPVRIRPPFPCSMAGCPVCYPDPNAGRPGYRYNAMQDRWTPEADGRVFPSVSGEINFRLSDEDVRRMRDALASLEPGTIRVDGVFGEGSFSYQWEPDGD